MVRLYTKTGDDGETGLWGGQRTGKDSLRIMAIGEVDELNAAIGWARGACGTEIGEILKPVQSDLFDLGATLARTDGAGADKLAARTPWLENQIDDASARVSEMKHFILPGGCEAAARLHLARTICRRAERSLVALHRREPGNRTGVIYLNRLSDLLFALARRANHEAGVADIPWQGKS